MTLRDLARPLILSHVVSGRNTSFWHDNWTLQGPIFSTTGPNGPMVSGISIDDSVSSIVTNGAWNISQRSRHPILRHIRSVLPEQIPDVDSMDDDYFLWRNSLLDPPSARHPQETYLSIWFGRVQV